MGGKWNLYFHNEMIRNNQGYLVVIVYAKETWTLLDRAQAFFAALRGGELNLNPYHYYVYARIFIIVTKHLWRQYEESAQL